jgi:hypothetical protein
VSTDPKPAVEQLSLPGADLFAGIGLTHAPDGLGRMTSKQRLFCVEFLKCGKVAESARRAGYSNPESDGSKVQKHPVVAAFLGQAAVQVAKNADQLVRRASERSRWLHSEIEAEMQKEEKDRSFKKLRQLHVLAQRADMLLGSLIGKLNINVHGDMTHTHVITDEQRTHLLELQKVLAKDAGRIEQTEGVCRN